MKVRFSWLSKKFKIEKRFGSFWCRSYFATIWLIIPYIRRWQITCVARERSYVFIFPINRKHPKKTNCSNDMLHWVFTIWMNKKGNENLEWGHWFKAKIDKEERERTNNVELCYSLFCLRWTGNFMCMYIHLNIEY